VRNQALTVESEGANQATVIVFANVIPDRHPPKIVHDLTRNARSVASPAPAFVVVEAQ
jgi:hypothetical protein